MTDTEFLLTIALVGVFTVLGLIVGAKSNGR